MFQVAMKFAKTCKKIGLLGMNKHLFSQKPTLAVTLKTQNTLIL